MNENYYYISTYNSISEDN